jgi:glycerate-2-kinase
MTVMNVTAGIDGWECPAGAIVDSSTKTFRRNPSHFHAHLLERTEEFLSSRA